MRTIQRPRTPEAAPTTHAPATTAQPGRNDAHRSGTGAQAWAARAILDNPVTASVLHAVWSGEAVVIAPSPPGSGKTRLVALLAATLADQAGLRVAVAAQTRDQAVEIARRVGTYTGTARLGWAAAGDPPDLTGAPVAVMRGNNVRFPPTGGGVVIATTAKWLRHNPDALASDVVLVDEAWQATYADVGALGAFAAQIVCVGDPGQIDPVVTGTTRRWEGSRTGPHLPAPDALLAAHPGVASVVRLRHTWRLGPDTTALIQPAFYPDLPFTSKRPPEHITTRAGAPLTELTTRPVLISAGPTDPAFIAALADAARALIGCALTTPAGSRPVTAQDVAVVCPHVAQAAAVRATLTDLPGVLVGTTNALQGMERPAAVVAHPLAGYRDLTRFNTDPGRACVMLSRHRAHAVIVTDTHTGTVLAEADPSAPGVGAHRTIWNTLHP